PAPTPPVHCAWSQDGRNAWLEGRVQVRAKDVFGRLCAAFEEFLDLPDEEKPEIRNQNDERMTNDEARIRHSYFVIDSSFGFRHSGLPSPTAALLSLWTMLTY